MGDITIDFMNMIDVMVDVMATGTGMGGGGNNNNNNNNNNGMGMGGGSGMGMGGNNNNNNNNNGKRRRRGLNSKHFYRMDVINAALDSFESQPSNVTMIEKYEILAKNHIDQYWNTLKNRGKGSSRIENDSIGPRLNRFQAPKQVMIEYMAMEFFDKLMESFQGFKDYCKTNSSEPDCAILDTDLSFWESKMNSL